MNFNLRILLMLTVFSFLLFIPKQVFCFSITPAQIEDVYMAPGDTKEFDLVFSQNGSSDKIVKASLNNPFIKKWIRINYGRPIKLSSSSNRVKIPVVISIPKDAKEDFYQASISFTSELLDEGGKAQAKVGFQFPLNLVISKKRVDRFEVKSIRILSAMASKVFLPGQVSLELDIENNGNTYSAQRSLLLQIYNQDRTSLQTRILKTVTLRSIPFGSGKQVVNMPIKNLALGNQIIYVELVNDKKTDMESEQVLQINAIKQENTLLSLVYFLGFHFKAIVIVMSVILLLKAGNVLIRHRMPL
ncbi:MAG: hypothetical protein ABIH87_04500 [bacterium]